MTDRTTNRPTRTKFSNPMIDNEIADRVRDVVRGMATVGHSGFTLRQFVEEAFTAQCARLEELYNHGEPWPHIDAPLDRGRPGSG